MPRFSPLLAAAAVAAGLAVLGQATVARADDDHHAPAATTTPTAAPVATAGAGVAPADDDAPGDDAASAYDAQFVSLMDADRAQQGLPALSVSAQLNSVAAAWTDELITQGALSHDPFIVSFLPAGWTRWGENVGMGITPATLETAFMASAPHRANILGQYNEVGVGAETGANGMLFVTVDFAAVDSTAGAAASGQLSLIHI